MVELKASKNVASKLNSDLLFHRIYASMIEDGVNVTYGEMYSKFTRNGLIKLLKSLGFYKTTGARETKKVFVHEKVLLAINLTIEENNITAKTLIDLTNGKYVGIAKMEVNDFSNFYALPDNEFVIKEHSFGTYIIFNNKSNLFKIGKTKNLGKRMSLLENEYGVKLQLIGFLDTDIESELHIKYSKNRVHGEWFNISMDTALDICNKYNFKHSKQ